MLNYGGDHDRGATTPGSGGKRRGSGGMRNGGGEGESGGSAVSSLSSAGSMTDEEGVPPRTHFSVERRRFHRGGMRPADAVEAEARLAAAQSVDRPPPGGDNAPPPRAPNDAPHPARSLPNDAPAFLALDMRSHAGTLEEAIVRVKLFLDTARRRGLAEGWAANGTLPATIILDDAAGDGDDGRRGDGTATVLRSVLARIFRNRRIEFECDASGGVMRVDALSGLRDDEDDDDDDDDDDDIIARGQRDGERNGIAPTQTERGERGEGRNAALPPALSPPIPAAPPPNHVVPPIDVRVPPPYLGRNASMAQTTIAPPTLLQTNMESIGGISSLGEGSYYRSARPRAVAGVAAVDAVGDVVGEAGAAGVGEGEGAARSHWARLEGGEDCGGIRGEDDDDRERHRSQTGRPEGTPSPPLRRPSHEPRPRPPQRRTDSLPRPADSSLPAPSSAAARPPDPGAGMLYNPFDSIAHALLAPGLAREASGGNRSGGSDGSNPYYNALSGAPTMLGRERDVHRHQQQQHRHEQQQQEQLHQQHQHAAEAAPSPLRSLPPLERERSGGGMHRYYDLAGARDRDGGSGGGGGGDGPHPHRRCGGSAGERNLLDAVWASRLRTRGWEEEERFGFGLGSGSPDEGPERGSDGEAARRAALDNLDADGPRRTLRRESSSSRRHPDDPFAMPSAPRSPPRHGSVERRGGDLDLQRAILESQAAHIAHTRQQVDGDIQFRRALELAANASALEAARRARSGRTNAAASDGDDDDEEEEELVRMAARRSMVDEEERATEARRAFDRELEAAVRQSEQLEEAKREEDARLRRSEEELIRDLLAKTEADAEEERRGEEEAFRRALERSLSERRVSEDDLVEDAVRRSLSENDRGDGSRGEDEDPEEMVRRVMRLSLDEERRAAREEEEQIRAALEWSVLESACSD